MKAVVAVALLAALCVVAVDAKVRRGGSGGGGAQGSRAVHGRSTPEPPASCVNSSPTIHQVHSSPVSTCAPAFSPLPLSPLQYSCNGCEWEDVEVCKSKKCNPVRVRSKSCKNCGSYRYYDPACSGWDEKFYETWEIWPQGPRRFLNVTAAAQNARAAVSALKRGGLVLSLLHAGRAHAC